MNSLGFPQSIRFAPIGAKGDAGTRFRRYEEWLANSGNKWEKPELRAYRDYLLDVRGLSPSTVSNYLGTVRQRYRELLVDNDLREMLYAQVEGYPSDRKAYVDECLTRISNAVDARKAKVKILKKQDRTDEELRWLTPTEIGRLMDAIQTQSENELTYWRSTALITLGLITGARRKELARLMVDDLRQSLNGELALLIREGKGHKQRLVPYGVMAYHLEAVDCWLQISGIGHGAIFRGLTSNRKRVLKHGCSVETVNNIVSGYTFMLDTGEVVYVKPHDLRRTYAGNFFKTFGWDRIQQLSENLGHESIKTTIVYLGVADASSRAPEVDLFAP